MKKGNKFLIYISGMTFCCLFMLFFSFSKVKALDESAFVTSCVDRASEGECSSLTEDAYFILEKINIADETITDLIIPRSSSKTIDVEGENAITISGDIEVIGNGFESVINASDAINLNSLILPSSSNEYPNSGIVSISDNALKNISKLTTFEIPNSLMRIGKNVFDSGSVVDVIYLNHYVFTLTLDYVEIDQKAFEGVSIGKIICEDHDAYKFYMTDDSSTIKDQNIVTLVTYNYHKYESSSYIGDDAIIASVIYEVGGKNTSVVGATLPNESDFSSYGLNFLGWYLDNSEVNQSFVPSFEYTKYEYDVYPKYSLNKVSLNISAQSGGKEISSVKYDGSDNLVTLTVNANVDSRYTIKSKYWYSGSDIINSNVDSISFGNVVDSGTYKFVIEYEYVFFDEDNSIGDGSKYSMTSEASKMITITKAPLYVNVLDMVSVYGNKFTSSDINYTISGLLGNDGNYDSETGKYLGVSVVTSFYYPDGEIEVGTYVGALKVSVTSIDKSETLDKIGNYNIIYSYGTHVVNRRNINVYYNEGNSGEENNSNYVTTYGEVIDVKQTFSETIEEMPSFDSVSKELIYGKKITTIIITFAKENGVDVGEYDIIGIKEVDNSNYSAKYVHSLTTGKVIVNPKVANIVVDTNSCRKENTGYWCDYNGNNQDVNVYYEDINGSKVEVPFTISKNGETTNKVINAGAYIIDVLSLESDNYTFENIGNSRIYLTINKVDPVVTYSDYQSFVYTGEKINPIAVINNKEQTPSSYTCTLDGRIGDYCIGVSSIPYSVSIHYDESENYNAYTTRTIRMSITPYTINITPKSFTFYYGEIIRATQQINVNGEEVVVEFDVLADERSPVGEYDIAGVVIKDPNSSGNHPNYVGSINVLKDGTNKVKIIKRPVTLVYYNYTDLVYDGKEKQIGVYAIDNLNGKVVDLDLNIVCDEGIIKDAKTYHLRTYFTSEYYEATNPNVLEFSIKKGTYDLSNIKFNSQRFTLDFKKHAISIEGELPQGVSVKYTIDGEEGNSVSSGLSHKVVATFLIDETNYEPVSSMEATLYIDMTWMFVSIGVVLLIVIIALVLSWFYVDYRRKHPRKIKLKIRNLVDEDLSAKRVATSVKDVLGDEKVETEEIENEDDIIEEVSKQNFIDRIYAASSDVKYYYSEVKNELLSYEGVSHSLDRKYEVFYHGTRQIAKLSICNNVLRLYVNLDPDKYDKKLYKHRDMSKIELHSRTPLRIDVNTVESLRHAKVFIRILRKKENLKSVSSFVRIDYEKFYTLKENIFPKLFKKMFYNNKEKKK